VAGALCLPKKFQFAAAKVKGCPQGSTQVTSNQIDHDSPDIVDPFVLDDSLGVEDPNGKLVLCDQSLQIFSDYFKGNKKQDWDPNEQAYLDAYKTGACDQGLKVEGINCSAAKAGAPLAAAAPVVVSNYVALIKSQTALRPSVIL
jgi:hypothetical protein